MNDELLAYIETHSVGESNYGYGTNDARIAKVVMLELVKAGKADFLLLRDDLIDRWWGSIVAAGRKAIEARDEKKRIYQVKMEAFNKLSDADRKILGIRKPTAPKG